MDNGVPCPECGKGYTRTALASHIYCPECEINFHQEWARKVQLQYDTDRSSWRCKMLGHNPVPSRRFGRKVKECTRCHNVEPNDAKPCGIYHPLPCGLDEDCEVPSEHFVASLNSQEIYELYKEETDG